MSRSSSMTYDPLRNPKTGEELQNLLRTLLPNSSNDPIVAGAGYSTIMFDPHGSPSGGSHPVGGRGALGSTWGGHDPRWTFADTITWMRGTHSFKGGFEFRQSQSYQEFSGPTALTNNANANAPNIQGGVISVYSPFRDYAFSGGNAEGTAYEKAVRYPVLADFDYRQGTAESGNYQGMYGLLSYSTGSIYQISQHYFVTDAQNPRWNNARNGEDLYIADLRNREFSFFFKDDWKVTQSLTLNLGARWEYYGVPWNNTGLTSGVKDGLQGMFGASGISSWDEWMPAKPVQTNYLTQQIFVGPHSRNPDIPFHNKDLNNWSPHVGFSWQLPWFGKGLTTLRGGYSISYTIRAVFDHFGGYSSMMTQQPGVSYTYLYRGHDGCNTGVPGTGCYLNYDNFEDALPLYDPQKGFLGLVDQPQILSLQPITKRDQGLTTMNPDTPNPYVQHLTLSLTRNVGSFLTLDVRYIGNLSRKLIGTIPINSTNFINNGLLDELKAIRRGSNDPNDWPILNM